MVMTVAVVMMVGGSEGVIDGDRVSVAGNDWR